MSETPLVIHHGNCFDGFSAAWVARQRFPNCELVPAVYGHSSSPPVVDGRDVYIIDYSYPRDVMIEMNEKAASLVVLDHHASVEKDCEGLSFCTFDMHRSGAGMAWDYFFEGEDRPHWINLIEDRDLWTFRYEDTKAFHAYVASIPMTLENWTKVNNSDLMPMITAGRGVLRYISVYVDNVVKTANMAFMDDEHAVAVANAPYLNCSEVGHALLEKFPEARFACTYYQHHCENGAVWRYSLRSRGDFDVSEVALKYGGGGHKDSAGFSSSQMVLDVRD